jgi:hypothetical protein
MPQNSTFVDTLLIDSRLRGYQLKSEGPGEKKKNPSAYNTLNDIKEKMADTADAPDQSTEAAELEEHGLGQPTRKLTLDGHKIDK